MGLNKERFEAKTVEEAITNATVSLGITSDELDYEVVEKGSSGFLGLNSKNAVINVWKKSDVVEEENNEVPVEDTKEDNSVETKEETKEDSKKKNSVVDPKAADEAKVFLQDVFSSMNLTVDIKTSIDEENNILEIELEGPEMGVIIGKRGQTLDSLQYLTSLAVNRKVDNYTKIKLDTEDYRNRRKATLENLAKNTAYKAKRNKRSVSLEAMNPYERRIIHSALQDDKYVTTHSEGEEPYRHVVVVPKNN
ncbi:MAG: protein jag [Lachnospiraceae bacterium]|nr:protein jag [Lachnospiraceae bacterium]MBQ9391162.1 protein jag [Lachnospiraceae bacterium]